MIFLIYTGSDTRFEHVKVGDIITIIGEDKNITAEQVADKADTITNELLCRLGDRLARIIV